MEFNGELGKLAYNGYEVDGFYLVSRMKDDIFEIKSFSNQLIDIWGNIDFRRELIDLNAKVHNLSSKKFGVEKPEIKIDNLEAKLNGKLDNPKGKLVIGDARLVLENNEEVVITGGARYLNRELLVDEIKINNNVLKGKYSLDNNSYAGTLFLIEENIGRYYGNTSLKYRVIGTAKVNGVGKISL